MRRSSCISLLALAIASNTPAFSQAPETPAEDAPTRQDLSSSLDRFVQDAIDEGLLTPARPADEVQPEPAPSMPERIVPEPSDTQPSSAEVAPPFIGLRPKHAVAEAVCADTDPFDFSGFHELRTYDDLLAWRRGAEGGFSSTPDIALAKAYIALGLNEEAQLQLDEVFGAEASALRRLAFMMEDRSAPELEYFREQAGCPGTSGLWYALALVHTDPSAAAKRLDASLNDFRKLPLQLRIEVAAKAVPALDGSGNAAMAAKLMASFVDPEVQASSRLVFNRALLAMPTGGQTAEYAMRNYLNVPEFRADATASLLRNGYRLEPQTKIEEADRIVSELNEAEPGDAVSGNLDMMLNELEDVAGYGLTLQLADMPATQAPEAQARVKTHFAGLAADGLSSPDLYDNLQAMDALLRGVTLLDGQDGADQLYADASRLAIDLGWQNLATTFASRASNPEDLAEARASLAYRTFDHDTVKTLATQYSGNSRISRLAALSAVREGDAGLLLSVASRFDPDPETLLDMVELDAASRAWILPERFYAAAARLDGEEARSRVRRVTALREAGPRPAPNFTIAEIGTALDRIGQSLDPNGRGAF